MTMSQSTAISMPPMVCPGSRLKLCNFFCEMVEIIFGKRDNAVY